MPELVRLYVRSIAFGFGIAVVFTGLVIWLDVAGVGHLILGSDIGWIAALMMVFFNGIIFGAVQFAYQVMGMAEDDGKSGGRGLVERTAEPVLIPVIERVKTKRRR